MKMVSFDDVENSALANGTEPATASGFGKLAEIAWRFQDLQELLKDLICLAGEKEAARLTKIEQQLSDTVPTVTMIGQVKAGKTSLVNAMIGRPDFLPADVNPWTSVVTSLHMNTNRPPGAPGASFQMFAQDEWDNLVENGGRLGELSRRANADDELRKVNEQIAEMREKTRQRLGRKFELLLGQKHDFDAVTEDLIQRYVCMGDDPGFAEGDEAYHGRFADVTKSADIFLKADHLPMPLTIRDTPGVNDTFLMREQITINALRGSRLCVVVLSAHQALTTTDMAMIRMISNVKSRDLLIFVNRIDELSDPANQIEEVRASIKKTLKEHNGPVDAKILFGSAYWANLAISDTLSEITEDSADAMFKLAEATLGEYAEDMSPEALVWQLSGVPELFEALGERIETGVAGEALSNARQQAMNIASAMTVSSSIVSVRLNGNKPKSIPRPELESRLAAIEDSALKDLQAKLALIEKDFSQRIDRSRKRFLERALEVLMQHLENDGGDKVWHYSADGLRLLLRSSFLVLSKNYTNECQALFDKTAQDLAKTYKEVFDVTTDGFAIEPPAVPNVPPPVTLGATIALDLHTSWWKGWWQRRKGVRAQAEHFYNLIEAETAPLIEQLDSAHVAQIRENAVKVLEEFLDEQGGQLLDVCQHTEISENDVKSLFGVSETQERDEMLRSLIDDLAAEEMEKA